MTTKSSGSTRPLFPAMGFAAMLAAAGGIAFALPEAGMENPIFSATATSADAGTPQEVIKNWPEKLRTLANVLIERYGNPGMADSNALVWIGNGPWRKTVLHREGFTHSVLDEDRDHLEQVITYPVPENKIADLKRFDGRLEVLQSTDELSSRSDSESMNYLALNLADEIVTDQRTVQEARAFYDKVKTLEKTGKSSAYLEGFIFILPRSDSYR